MMRNNVPKFPLSFSLRDMRTLTFDNFTELFLAHEPAELAGACAQLFQLNARHAGFAQGKALRGSRSDERRQMLGQRGHVAHQ